MYDFFVTWVTFWKTPGRQYTTHLEAVKMVARRDLPTRTHLSLWKETYAAWRLIECRAFHLSLNLICVCVRACVSASVWVCKCVLSVWVCFPVVWSWCMRIAQPTSTRVMILEWSDKSVSTHAVIRRPHQEKNKQRCDGSDSVILIAFNWTN